MAATTTMPNHDNNNNEGCKQHWRLKGKYFNLTTDVDLHINRSLI